MIKDRIQALRRVRAGDLIPNAKNWRKHPQAQREALAGILAEVGYVDALLVRETPAGLELVDGHLRAGLDPDQEVPVLVVDLDDAEAAKVLATFDPLAAMAEADAAKLDDLLREVATGSEAIGAMLESLAESNGLLDTGPTELKQLSVKPPPAMTWVLLGIPTVRFGEIAQDVERIALLPDVFCEMAINAEDNGQPQPAG